MSLSRDESKQPLLRTVAATLTALSCFSLCLRLLSRWVSRAGWGWDDGFALFAWVLVMVGNAFALNAIHHGLGAHAATLDGKLPTVGKAIYLDELFIHLDLTAIKIVVLLFYGRIFSTPGFRKALWFVGALTMLWILGTFPAIVVNCLPIRKAWYPEMEGHCINLKAFLVGQAVPNTVLDIALLCLPLTFVWGLQMNNTNKLALSVVFCVGTFEIIASIVRLVNFSVLKIVDPPWDFWRSELWSRIEVNAGFICCCLIATGPLVKFAMTGIKSWSDRTPDRQGVVYSGDTNRRKSWSKPRFMSRHQEDFERLSSGDRRPLGSFERLNVGSTARARGLDIELDERVIGLDEIHMTRDVEVLTAPKT